jgi:chromosome segregation ATPase
MDTIQQQGQFFSYIIAFLGACIFVIQFYAIWFYYSQRDVVEKYHSYLNENPDVNLEDALGNRQVSKDSPLRKRIEIIKEAIRHKRPAAVSEFSALSDEHDHSHWFNSIPATFIGLFLIVGLGGTLYLLNTLLDDSDMKSIVQASGDLNTLKLREAVGKLYGGFGHAFVASLAGIIATCILVFVRGIGVNPIRGKFYHALDSLTVTELLPRLQPREVALPDALVNTSESMRHVGDQMRAMVEIVQAASDSNRATSEIARSAVAELASFADSMKAAAKALDSSVRRLDKTFGDEGDWAKRNIALDVGMKDLTVKIGNQNEVTNTLSEAAINLKQLFGDSMEKIAPMLPHIQNFIVTHPERVLKIEKQLYGIDGNLNAVDARLDATIGTKIAKLSSAILSLQEILSPLSKEQLAPLGNHILSLDGRMESLNGALKEGLPRINTRMESAEKEIAAVLSVLKEIEARIGPLQIAAEAVVFPLKAGTKAIESIAEFAPSSVESTRELAKTNVDLVTSQQAFAKATEPLIASLGALKEDIAGVNGRLTTVESAGNSIVNAGKAVESAIQKLATETSQWKTEVTQLSEIIGEQTQESELLRKAIETRREGNAEDVPESKGSFFNNWFNKQ